MKRGIILFAFNSPKYDYFKMAEFTAKRINHLLKLPVTIITDENSLQVPTFHFDNILTVEPDTSNSRDWGIWINKGRYKAYDLSPYDETILLDVDYIVNSDKLLKLFELQTDFCCHNKTEFLMQPNLPQEVLSVYSFNTLWATVVYFKKNNYVKQIFDCLKMVQENFQHYANIHNFVSATFRNDYALTLALNIVNGHLTTIKNYIPWNLLHIGKNTQVIKNKSDNHFIVTFDNWKRGKIKKEYIIVKDMDFHMMNKDNFLEVIDSE